MKKLLSVVLGTAMCWAATAQTPEEILRMAWNTQNGTARSMAIGGTMGSLGGDLSANHINPAGIALYKTNEFALTPGFQFNRNKFNYRGSDSAANKSSFANGVSGFVFASVNGRGSKWTSSAIALTVSQVAHYNNKVQYSGFNNFSSFTEQYLEELTRDRADTNAALSNYIFGSSLAFRTFLIDTLSNGFGQVIGYQSLVPISTGTRQTYSADTRGGMQEIAIGFGENMADRLYLGGSIVIPISSYNRTLTYSERDATTVPNNEFSNFTYSETFSSRGVGLGAKLGLLYKLNESFRMGFAFHTPQLMGMTDQIRSSISANTENYAGQRFESSDNLNSGNPGVVRYNITTPWRMLGSLSYVLRETKDVRQQKGFLSMDVEYVNYRGGRVHAADENSLDPNLLNYYTFINNTVKEIYRGNFNFRAGGELKFNTWMVRLGGAYYGSPYADRLIKANRILATGGLGYRNKGMFIDLAYSHVMNRDFQFPYRLSDKPNVYASQRGFRGQLMITLGVKF